MKEKIVICVNSLRIGGTERVVSILLEHLKDRFDLHLVLYNDVGHATIPKGIKVYSLSQPVRESNIAMLLKGPYLSYRLYRYCRKNSITSVVSFLNRACYLSALMRKLFNYRGRLVMCQRTHQSALVSFGSPWYRFSSNLLLKWSYTVADLIHANSMEIKTDLKKYVLPRVPVSMIHNPVDLEEIRLLASSAPEPVVKKEHFIFIILGGLREEKNHELLLRAFALLKNKKAKLWIVGGGKLEPRLKKLTLELSIADYVIFLGHQTNPFPFLKQADCLVMSSKVEGFPNALLEGLASGLPVISTDCMSGPREILAPGTVSPHTPSELELAEYGILLPPLNVNLLAMAMDRMIEDASLREAYRLKAAGRAAIFDIHSLKARFISAFSSTASVEDEYTLN